MGNCMPRGMSATRPTAGDCGRLRAALQIAGGAAAHAVPRSRFSTIDGMAGQMTAAKIE